MLRSAESDSRKKKKKHYIFSSQLRASKSYRLPWGKLGRPGNIQIIQIFKLTAVRCSWTEGQKKEEMRSVACLPSLWLLGQLA